VANRELAINWLHYAQTDYDVAVHDLTFHPVPVEIICYHCQQAGEKALKALLAYYDEEITHTHDLYRLLQQCESYAPNLTTLASQAKRLTDFATMTRYPVATVDLEESDMRLALSYAKQILDQISPLVQNPVEQDADHK
jgi:HEPN domain-containing protein